MLPWFGLTGMIISGLSLLPSFLIFYLCPDAGILTAMQMALVWLGGEAFLTGGMHWDGLADLGDALHSLGDREKFRAILNDSRLGVYGALSLVFFALFQWLAASSIFFAFLRQDKQFFCIILLLCSGFWSRLCPLYLAYNIKAADWSRLGALFCGKMNTRFLFIALLQSLLCLCIMFFCHAPFRNICALAIGQLFFVRYLALKAGKAGGMSGDFMGAGIVLSQTLFLICAQV